MFHTSTYTGPGLSLACACSCPATATPTFNSRTHTHTHTRSRFNPIVNAYVIWRENLHEVERPQSNNETSKFGRVSLRPSVRPSVTWLNRFVAASNKQLAVTRAMTMTRRSVRFTPARKLRKFYHQRKTSKSSRHLKADGQFLKSRPGLSVTDFR